MHNPLDFAVSEKTMIHCENMNGVGILEEATIIGEWLPINIKYSCFWRSLSAIRFV